METVSEHKPSHAQSLGAEACDGINEYDVIVIGAGISGISAAYHLQKHNPDKTFTILEARADIGGTWDLFRYPGIRSDSDMYTLGFSFRPWTNEKAIADAPSIMNYLRETVDEFALTDKIQFGRNVTKAEWMSDKAQWQLTVEEESTGTITHYRCNFLFLCSGYYNYQSGYRPQFMNEEAFAGDIVHPQFWPEELAYEGKKVTVIGSGATTVTLVPELAKRAAQVTMLQRTPTYIVGMPAISRFAVFMHKYFPDMFAYRIIRGFKVFMQRFMFWYCKTKPEKVKAMLRKGLEDLLGEVIDIDKHLTPPYNPWDQRMCLAPDADFFMALKKKRTRIVTDEITQFTKTGIELKSGEMIESDIIVTATGLKLQFFGGMEIVVDGRPVKSGDVFNYKGMMFEGVPNMAQSFGYTNASWTLKCDLTSKYVSRLLNHMSRHKHDYCTPVLGEPLDEQPMLNLSSGYIQRAKSTMPKQGVKAPWQAYQNYLIDLFVIGFGSVKNKGLVFSRKPAGNKQTENQESGPIKQAAE